jgi:hypothetical protein
VHAGTADSSNQPLSAVTRRWARSKEGKEGGKPQTQDAQFLPPPRVRTHRPPFGLCWRLQPAHRPQGRIPSAERAQIDYRGGQESFVTVFAKLSDQLPDGNRCSFSLSLSTPISSSTSSPSLSHHCSSYGLLVLQRRSSSCCCPRPGTRLFFDHSSALGFSFSPCRAFPRRRVPLLRLLTSASVR